MIRWGNISRVVVVGAWLAVVSLQVFAADLYKSRSLTPEHRRELERSIAQCVGEITRCSDPERRSVLQEELCKKLIQTEDYDNAVRVARAIHATPGINAERRAVHHFLIAQIYAMRMEASPSIELMEQNRQAAIAAAQEVVEARYPKKWLISESALQLLKTLRDPAHLRQVRAWVQKRQQEEADSTRLAASRAQTAAIERALKGNPHSGRLAVNEPVREAAARRLEPIPKGKALVSYSRAETPEPLASQEVSLSNRTSNSSSQASSTPIVIEGTRIQALWRVPVMASPYAPGAAPTPSPASSQYGFRNTAPLGSR